MNASFAGPDVRTNAAGCIRSNRTELISSLLLGPSFLCRDKMQLAIPLSTVSNISDGAHTLSVSVTNAFNNNATTQITFHKQVGVVM